MNDYFNQNLQKLPSVGEKRARLFAKLGINTIGDLLSNYPRHYEDLSKCFSVSSAPVGETCCVKAFVSTTVSSHRVRKGLTVFRCKATDGITEMQITIFNNKYAAAALTVGGEYLFFGKVEGNLLRKSMSSPQIEPITGARIRPIYRQTEGLSSKVIESVTAMALKRMPDEIEDNLPDYIRQEEALCHKRYAIERIHFPKDSGDIEIAKKRLVFEELLVLQLGLLRLRGRVKVKSECKIQTDYTKEFLKTLPFEPTGAQLRAISEAIDDLKGDSPMNRLLQGDVGSGKTLVAAAIMHTVCKNGYQAAMMAPTEILAEQHFKSLTKMLKGSGISVMLLTASTPAGERKKILNLLSAGQINLIVGTHALISQSVQYCNLGLAITDEQHRFGVAQRTALANKGINPHIYVMSATPIPRTLGLIIYGDLDISVLDELPKGRQPIETYCVKSALRHRAYNYIKKHLDEGRQGYIVCPMVDEGEMDLAAATQFYEKLSNGEFKDYSVGLLNGRMKSADKEDVMRRFSLGEIDLLISTTVVEVGVDVPNAVIMVIENAERFGLSQLHQLRGRVGRGEHKATCILISDAENDDAVKRLKVMCQTTDGFKIADADLKARGPGDFFGSRQHGLPELKIANIFDDMKVLKTTQRRARDIINKDPDLTNHKGLSESVDKLFADSIQNIFS
jgi:ATP-dependent DNA helicase RecG